MKKVNVILNVDEDVIKSASGLNSLDEAITQELGWLQDSGILVEKWYFEDKINRTTESKTGILKEIKKLAEENLREPNDNIGYTMPDGKYHIFIEVDDIGSTLYGKELIYRIEPNRIDEDGAAEPIADVYTADFGDFAELLVGCMWCMDQFEADREQQKNFNQAERFEVDLGYATLVAEKGTTPGYKEVFVGLEDKDGVWVQDLAVIGGKYHYENTDDLANEVVQDKGISVKVYSDKDNEDYTHDFSIDIYEPEEELELSAAMKLEASLAHIDVNKLQKYLNEEMILEFESADECMNYFNLYDGQDFKNVEEMKKYQDEYGFGLNGKWYHISFDEALDVRTDAMLTGSTEQTHSDIPRSVSDTITRYVVDVIDKDDGYKKQVFVYADSENEMKEKVAQEHCSDQWMIGGWDVQTVPAWYKEADEGVNIDSIDPGLKKQCVSLDAKIKSAANKAALEVNEKNKTARSLDKTKE